MRFALEKKLMRREGRSSGVFKASVRVVGASQLVRVHTQVEMCLGEKRGVDENNQQIWAFL